MTTETNLRKLDEVRGTLTYNGWKIDLRDAEDALEVEHSIDFPKAIRKLKVKQKLHEGNRTHPRLLALDAIIPKLNYPGWEADVLQIEKMHAEVPFLARSDIGFNSKLRALEYSQLMYDPTGKVVQNEDDQEKENITTTANTGMTTEACSPLGSCIICGEAKSHAFIPCGHLCVCQECASKTMRRAPRCPVCRGSALETVQIFLS